MTLIMTSLILGIGSILKSFLTFYLALMKLLAILVIICKSVYQNNNNNISFFYANVYVLSKYKN